MIWIRKANRLTNGGVPIEGRDTERSNVSSRRSIQALLFLGPLDVERDVVVKGTRPFRDFLDERESINFFPSDQYAEERIDGA